MSLPAISNFLTEFCLQVPNAMIWLKYYQHAFLPQGVPAVSDFLEVEEALKTWLTCCFKFPK